jgi:hypothetical protein
MTTQAGQGPRGTNVPGQAPSSPGMENRRSTGLLRIPFVHRCRLQFEGSAEVDGFLVNLNVLGAYVARDTIPELGQVVACRFRMPGNEIEVVAEGVVAWLNPSQSHPVHSLPPGFGIRFERLSERDHERIEALVRGYVREHGGARR